MSYTVYCDICGSALDEHGQCPSCSAHADLERIIKQHDLGAGPASAIERQGPARSAHQLDEHASQTAYIAFDIEIAREIPEGASNWKAYRPFGISCAATLPESGAARLWHGTAENGAAADRMSREEVIALVEYLEAQAASGCTLLTWNGAGFDFDVLAEESGLPERCAALALHHVDMMFHFFCLNGYRLGLNTAAKGMGLAGKIPGMTGAEAPTLWKQGRRGEVLEYVRQDVVTTLELCQAVEKVRCLHWTSQRGKRQALAFPGGWLTVAQAERLPQPDVGWMSAPEPRSKFTGWMAPYRR